MPPGASADEGLEAERPKLDVAGWKFKTNLRC